MLNGLLPPTGLAELAAQPEEQNFLDEWFGAECQAALGALVAMLAAKKKRET